MSRYRGHFNVEQNSAVGPDVDVFPQPDVIQLSLGHAEPAQAEFSEVFSCVGCNLWAVGLIGAVIAV